MLSNLTYYCTSLDGVKKTGKENAGQQIRKEIFVAMRIALSTYICELLLIFQNIFIPIFSIGVGSKQIG